MPFQAYSRVIPTEDETWPQHGSSRPPPPQKEMGVSHRHNQETSLCSPKVPLLSRACSTWQAVRAGAGSKPAPLPGHRRALQPQPPSSQSSHPSPPAGRSGRAVWSPPPQCSPFPASSRGEKAPTQSRWGAGRRPPTRSPPTRPVSVRKHRRNCASASGCTKTFGGIGAEPTTRENSDENPTFKERTPPPPEYQSCNSDTRSPCKLLIGTLGAPHPTPSGKRLPQSGASVCPRSHARARRLRSSGRAGPRAERPDAQTHRDPRGHGARRGPPGPAAPTR